jgi:RHS repeat-associated protein
MRTRILGRGFEGTRLAAAGRIIGCALAASIFAISAQSWAQSSSSSDSKTSTATQPSAISAGAGTTSDSTTAATGSATVGAAATTADDVVNATDEAPVTEVDGSNGSFVNRVPLLVPPFHGLEPSLALSYDSGRGNGFVGVGWSVDGLSTIQRGTPRGGVPRYDSSDVYFIDGSEMVACGTGVSSPSCSTGGTHATRVESYLRIKQVTASNSWEVTARNGTRLTYAPLTTWCAGSGNVATSFRWPLRTVVDTHGNTVTYSYSCDGLPNQYVDTISYNGNTIKFYREARPDSLSYATGGGLGSWAWRLKTIDVLVGGQRARAYTLAYAVTETVRSRLTSIQQYGRDAVVNRTTGAITGGTSLPATALTLSSTQTSFAAGSWGSWTSGQVIFLDQWLRGDFNGDGKDDLAVLHDDCTVEMLVSSGSAFTKQSWSVAGCGTFNTAFQYYAVDVNGDGKADIVPDPSHNDVHVMLSTGSGFTYQTWATNDGINNTQSWLPLDINGDGRIDFVEATIKSACRVNGLVSTGSAFTRVTWTLTPAACPSTTSSFQTGDFNGDGKSDFATLDFSSGTLVIQAFLSTGSGYGAGGQWGTGVAAVSGDRWFAGDLNADGASDLVRISASGTTLSATAYVSSGNGFAQQSWGSGFWGSNWLSNHTWALGDVNGDRRLDIIATRSNSGTTTADVLESSGTAFVTRSWGSWASSGAYGLAGDYTGDGRTDIASFVNTNNDWWPNFVFKPNGSYPDLVTAVRNSLGGTTSVAYTPSSAWTNTNLPFILQTVSSLTRNDGRTTAATTSFSYAGGLWNWAERRFLGFRTRTATMPKITGESAGPKRISTFVQTVAGTSPLEQYEQQDGSGTTLRKRVEEWTLTTASLPYKALNTASWSYLYAGGSSKRTKVTRTFDSYGNVAQQTAWGNFDASGDERTAQTDYAPNSSAYIVSLPGRVQIFAGSTTGGTKLAETQVYYDGASAYTTAPTKGDATASRVWLNTTGAYLASTASYDSYGNPVSTATPLGDATQLVYDATYHLFPVEVRDPLYATDPRHKVQATWDVVCAQTTETRDLNNLATTYQYDALCRPIRTDTPGGGFMTMSYNSIGTPTAQYVEMQAPPADGSGNLWRRTYLDGFGRGYESLAKGPTSSQTIRVDLSYNLRGGLATATAPYYSGDASYATSFAYDAVDRVTQRKHPDNATIQQAYALGTGTAIAAVTVTDELGRTSTAHFDAFGRTVRTEQKLGASPVVTTYSYDLLDQLVGITDDAGNAWSYGYDSAGRQLSANDPDLGAWSYQYDDSDRLVLQTDALGQKTRLTYDGLDRILTKVARADTGLAETTSFTYDEARAGFYNVGALTTATNPYATILTNFDNEGRLAGKTYVVDGTSYPFAAGYDTGGRVLWQSYPDGDSVGSPANPILYDSAGRPRVVPGLVNAATYDARGNLTNIARANGTASVLGYSAARGWLTSIQTTAGATTLQDLVYSRDLNGRINGVTSGQIGESWSYGYDDLDRLLNASNLTDASLTQSFAYDRVGNMTSNSAIGAYTYPAAGTPRPHAVTATPLGSYGYDANGNMTSAAGDALAYDGENRLTSVNAVAFVYGPDGERLKKTAGGTTTLYLGDDVEVSGGVMTKYLPGDAQRIGSSTFWLHRDHLGSVRVATDAAGAVVHRANYRPFGERLVSISTMPESKAFIGERLDDETGLTYLHARYYDPVLARFLQADPIGVTGGLNLYSYSANNPINASDPFGTQSSSDGSITLSYGSYYRTTAGVDADPSRSPVGSEAGGSGNGNVSGGGGVAGGAANGNGGSGGAVAGGVGLGGSPSGGGAGDIAGGANFGHESGIARSTGGVGGDGTSSPLDTVSQVLSITASVAWSFVPGSSIVGCVLGGCGVGGWALAVASELPFVKPLRVFASAFKAFKELRLLSAAAEDVGGLAQVTRNRLAGNAFRDSLADSLEAAGRDVRKEVLKGTPFGKRFIDIEVWEDGRLLGGIECKAGCSRYTKLQQLKDWWLKDAEGYVVNVARDR